ncbi:MAG: DUF2589 domain-containing protein [Nitrosomonadales bacterium]|nr:DUF2589 domain-containing protein [Nitrosomonadales bacterium]
MLGQGKELSALNFAAIIGGPLIAAVNAQALAAKTTTSFIQNFAFKTVNGKNELQTVDFDFSQVLTGGSNNPTTLSDFTTIKVPLLTVIPIPYIRIDNMTIDFNATLHSVETTSISNDFAFTASAGGEYYGVNFSASISDKNTYQNSTTTDDTYSLRVTVHAVQDQMPAGMASVLGIFNNLIQSQASLVQTIVTAQVAKLTTEVKPSLPAPGP